MRAQGRPFGVTIIAVLAWLSATLHVVLGVLVIAGVLSSPGVTDTTAWVSVVVGCVIYLVSSGLFSGSNLARILVTISLSLSILSALLLALDNPEGGIAGPIIAAATALLGIVMLYTGRASRYFGTR